MGSDQPLAQNPPTPKYARTECNPLLVILDLIKSNETA
jgi:hypothetical protein